VKFESNVNIISPEEATGELERVYEKIKATRGTIAPAMPVGPMKKSWKGCSSARIPI